MAGDILIEWRFAQSTVLLATGTRPETGHYMQCTAEEGCASALGRLIEKTIELSGADAYVVRPNMDSIATLPGSPPYWHTYMLCTPYELEDDEAKSQSGKAIVWRVYRRVGSDRQPDELLGKLVEDADGDDGVRGDVVVVQDASYGFGGKREAWPPSLLTPRNDAWAVVRWKPKPEGGAPSPLWAHVKANFGNRIVLIVSADDLRVGRMRISRGLTWERTIEDLDMGLRRLWPTEYGDCSYVVVSFYGAGAAVYARTRRDYKGHLYYDPHQLRETWAEKYPGSMFGYTRCLTTAVFLQLLRMLDAGNADCGDPVVLGKAIVPALRAQLRLHREGFANTSHEGKERIRDHVSVPTLHFPLDSIADTIVKSFDQGAELLHPTAIRYASCAIPQKLDGRPAKTDRLKWKILREALADYKEILLHAKRIVLKGVADVGPTTDYPLRKFGELVLTDRTEIESYSIIASLFKNYLDVRMPKNEMQTRQPLSIAVFGAPGSGKSFGVTEVANHVAKDQPLRLLTFNLSQFSSAQAINDALHQVRDVGVAGAMPVVFWDEFDSNLNARLGWLRYFLAPMQDGTFQEGPVTHTVGPAIFVFAGGTNSSMAEFEKQALSKLGADAKAPDFLSRLKGHVDVLSLDHPANYSIEDIDASIALRRALLLSAQLKNSGAHLFQVVAHDDALVEEINIDPGLVYAFLTVEKYRYAARSLDAIVRMSSIAGRSIFQRSSLAPSEQIRIHVNEMEFIRRLEEVPDFFCQG